MRKITKLAIDAFLNDRPFNGDNTQVIVHDNGTELILHSNCIANKQNGKLQITAAGWKTNTTKERLNALPGVNIQQINFEWFLNGKLWDGKPIDIIKNIN